jgi:hypothetical protein
MLNRVDNQHPEQKKMDLAILFPSLSIKKKVRMISRKKKFDLFT